MWLRTSASGVCCGSTWHTSSPASRDLACSGGAELARRAQRIHIHVAAIALEEGFAVHTRKTRIMRQGVRQQLAGIVINQRTNLRRRDYDLLKATLFNCIRHGPDSQNR